MTLIFYSKAELPGIHFLRKSVMVNPHQRTVQGQKLKKPGGIQTHTLVIKRHVLYHCALATFLTLQNLFRLELIKALLSFNVTVPKTRCANRSGFSTSAARSAPP